MFWGDPNSMLVEPSADRCTITQLPDGVLPVVDASSTPTTTRDPRSDQYQTPVTQAVFDTGSAVVSVTTWGHGHPSGRPGPRPPPGRRRDPRPLGAGPENALVRTTGMVRSTSGLAASRALLRR